MNTMTERTVWYVVGGLFVLFLVVWTAMGNMEAPVTVDGFGMWFAAFLSLCILSFLYRDNPIYKFAESLFIGVSAGYVMVQGVWEQLIKNLFAKLLPSAAATLVEGIPEDATPDLLYLVPLVLGILLLMRLSPKGGWIARWPLAFIVGWAAGTNLVRYLTSDFAIQVDETFIPLLIAEDGAIDWMKTFTNIVLVVGVLTALIYFFFSVEHKGAFGAASKLGIWVLMITFGAAFGYTVMGRIALLVGRMEFLFIDWMHVIGQ
jgi:hypothetical protein